MDKIGRFEILSEIAHSPIARVYKASDPENGQTIALKAVSLQTLGEQATAWVQAVLGEAETTKTLSSHNIAVLYGAGDIDELFCAAMEYIQGNSIANMLARQEGFSVWDLQDIARQVCQGLDHAHSHNVVHYSLEPAKIMVAWDGTVKILGFGISSMGAIAAQNAGAPSEVLHYMSPEQLRGEPLDARSNVFSLGAILYEMMAERKAFPGEDSEQVRQLILNSMPAPPNMVRSKVPVGLSDVLMKALSKLPEQRFASGQELVNALEQSKEKETASKAPKRKAPEPVRGLNLPKRPAAAETETAAAEPAAEIAPPVAPPRLAVASPKSAAAAAGAGWSGSGTLDQAPPPRANLSTAWPAEAEVEAPAAPPPAESGSPGKSKPSFSDVSELPPLKEVYIPSAPAPAPEIEPMAAPEVSAATLYGGPAEVEKPKAVPAEIAKRAVREIRNTPPKLYLYAVGAAVAIILLIVLSIAYHIYSQNSLDEGGPAQSSSTISEPASKPAAPAPAASSDASGVTVQTVPTIAAARPSGSTEIRIPARRGRRKAAKAARAPAVVPGQLNVSSVPSEAQIQIDGNSDPAWVTPSSVAGIEPGEHTVTITKPGYIAETRTIQVAAGSKSFLVVQLAPAGASAFISSVPSGAEVLVDGKDVGHATPVQIKIQKPGVHAFAIRKNGYLEETTTANLQAGQTFQFAPVLRQLGRTDEIRYAGRFKKLFGGGDVSGMGSLKVSTDPKGAQIMVNHQMLDRNSPAEFYLNPGLYMIDITLSGYKSVHRVVNISKGGKLSIDESLNPQ